LTHAKSIGLRSQPGSNVGALEGILHPKYNEYHSFALPLQNWLESQGVKIRTSTNVTDIAVSEQGGETVATGVTLRDADGEHRLQLTRDDLVFFTNGSIVQNATQADTSTVPLCQDLVRQDLN
jgi:oleate hydratase